MNYVALLMEVIMSKDIIFFLIGLKVMVFSDQVDFAYWRSCIGKGLPLACKAGLCKLPFGSFFVRIWSSHNTWPS